MRHATEAAAHLRSSHTKSVDAFDSHKEDKQRSLAVYVGYTCVYVVVHQAQLQAALLAGDAVVYCSVAHAQPWNSHGKQRFACQEVCIRRGSYMIA